MINSAIVVLSYDFYWIIQILNNMLELSRILEYYSLLIK